MSIPDDHRWNGRLSKFMPSDPAVDAFLDEIIQVCQKHNMSIGHEDSHGAFEVCDYEEGMTEWLCNAHDQRRPE